MPIYEYECSVCGKFEAIQKAGESGLTSCPHGRSDCPIGKDPSSVKRLISSSAFHLKGSGWYKTDYAGSSAGATSSSSGSSSSGTSGDAASSGSSSEGGESKTAGGSGGCGSSCACH